MKKQKHNKSLRVVLSAAYGMGNIGDEAICEAIIQDLRSVRPEVSVTVLALEEEYFTREHKNLLSDTRMRVCSMDTRKRVFVSPRKILGLVRGIIALWRADVFVWGGGNIIRNRTEWLSVYIKPLRLAQFLGKPVVVWSIGVDDIKDRRVAKLAAQMKKPLYVSVRDHASKKNLIRINSLLREEDVRVVRDPVFRLEETHKISGKALRIGFNVTFWKADFSDNKAAEEFARGYAKVLSLLSQKLGATLLYLPTTGKRDRFMYDRVRKHIEKEIVIEESSAETPAAYIQEVARTSIFIGMRMHALILASCVRDVVLFGIISDEKVEALVGEHDTAGRFFRIEDVVRSAEGVAEEMIRMYETGEIEDIFKEARACSMIPQDTLRVLLAGKTL